MGASLKKSSGMKTNILISVPSSLYISLRMDSLESGALIFCWLFGKHIFMK